MVGPKTAIAKDLGLDRKQARLDGDGPAQPPQQRGQTNNKRPFDGGLWGIVVQDNSLEPPVGGLFFENRDDALGGQTMAERIAPGALFAAFGAGPGAALGIAAV